MSFVDENKRKKNQENKKLEQLTLIRERKRKKEKKNMRRKGREEVIQLVQLHHLVYTRLCSPSPAVRFIFEDERKEKIDPWFHPEPCC